MKIIANSARILVGLLFIISGFVKIVDPIGTAIKLDEYFVIFGDNFSPLFELFLPHVVMLSVLITALEIILGVALLFLFQPKTTIVLLFAQIVFFTLLTFYSATTGEVTDCGCFGDAMPLTPWQSFYKDLVLLILIIILFLYRKKFNAEFDNKIGFGVVAATTVACLFFAKYNLDHLPVIDFRPYKIGNNISEKRKDGKAGVIHYRMSKEGEEKLFETYPTDDDWTYVDYVTVKEPELPSINDFNLFDINGNETTEEVLSGKQIVILSQKIDAITDEQIAALATLAKTAIANNIKPILLTGSGFEKGDELIKKMGIQLPVYTIDEVVVKAMIRSNPGIMILNEAVVRGKWHINDIPTFTDLEAQF